MIAQLPFISVIIPVFNDAERLKLCLDAFNAQTYPKDRFEVIVIDNGSVSPPRKLVESYRSCIFTEKSAPGSYAARNHGLELARGDLLGFTDSDCIPAPDWLAAGQLALVNHASCGFVGGRIEVFPRHASPTTVELYDMVFGLHQESNVAKRRFAATANMFTRRATMDRCGPFDAKVKSGGDLEWGQRVSAQGLPSVYDADVLVRHPARRNWSDISRQARRHAGGQFDWYMTYEPHQFFSRRFWRTAWRRFFPNIGAIHEARQTLRSMGRGPLDWIRVSCVILGLQYITFFEFVRLWFGFSSERR